MRVLPLLALALALPAASATWAVSGSFEPDTQEDVDGQRMYLEPDETPSLLRVYFNAFPSDRTAVGFAEANPNLGDLRSRHLPPAAMGMTAWLGVWKDCNRDGHVGHVETLAIAYRSELLLDDGICPPGSRFNRFSWVTEFLYISPDAQPHTASFPRVIWDPEVKVWGDFGRPRIEGERQFGCAEPFARGTFESTGGMIAAVDCHLGHQGGRFLADTDGLGLVPPFDGEGGVYHPENACGHPLNVHVGVHGGDPCAPDDPGLVGGGADPMVSVWDCSAGGDGGIVRVIDPLDPRRNRTWFYVGVPPLPTAPQTDPDGSAYMAADALIAQCDRAPAEEGFAEEQIEPTHPGSTPADPKRFADFLFEHDMPGGSVGTTPASMGLRGIERAPWNAERVYRTPNYHANLVRASDLQGNAAQWFTFYAHVGPSVLASGARVPTASPGIYGTEACGDATSGVRGGWDCDAEHWYDEELDGVETPGAPRPGEAYHLRDTDCYDGAVADGYGVYASAYLLSDDDPCPAMG